MSAEQIGDLSERRRQHKENLERAVDLLVNRLSRDPRVQRIILFGSYVRGRADLLTDIDAVVIMNTELPFLERLRWLYESLSLPVDADIVCYTPEEWEANKDKPFFRTVRKAGRVVYERR
ncbi:MAG: nucleotidyltransferase domain-containing protein [Armatimonadetes bacterium]|nr:nucleotidyltransferase domain-containing protein [Armatimonadota bacterium]MDW8121535.1 nucleotidyltransferase domain-containing protein [Armatimonadota bacterium]